MLNQDESRVSKMSWSMVLKAAERSSRQRQESFCEPIAVMRWSWMYKRDVLVECADGKQIGEDLEDSERKGDH